MKQYRDTFKMKSKRLTWAILGQLVWVIPVGIIGYYVHMNVAGWYDNYFGVPQAQQEAARLLEHLKAAEEPVIWNPSTMGTFLKISFLSIGTEMRASGLSGFSGLLDTLTQGLLILGAVLLLLYAFARIKRAYRVKTQNNSIVNAVCLEIMPELECLKAEIQKLREQIENQSSNGRLIK